VPGSDVFVYPGSGDTADTEELRRKRAAAKAAKDARAAAAAGGTGGEGNGVVAAAIKEEDRPQAAPSGNSGSVIVSCASPSLLI
jgi:hypothetical protein